MNGQIAALSRFISKSSDHCVSFFKVLKGKKNFEWTQECEEAFQSYPKRSWIVLIDLDGQVLKQSFHFDLLVSNNEVEYEALLVGLKLRKVAEANRVKARGDCLLVVSQINSEYTTKDKKMTAYLERVRELI